MPGVHATLSASAAARWIACPPSVQLTRDFPDVETDFAREGTDAHALCEHKVRTLLGEESKDPTEDLTFYNAEMEQCACDYCDFIKERVLQNKANGVNLEVGMVEHRVDFSEWVPRGFGTADCLLIYSNGTIEVVDFKYGKGVEVSAVENPQMKLYALGAYSEFCDLYDFDKIVTTIFQPRLGNVSSYAYDAETLLNWANTELKEAAQLASKGEGEFKAGPHCRFCKARHECRALAMENLRLARYDFRAPPLLSTDEIAEILRKIPTLTKWAEDISKFALNEAASGRVQYPGWKVVEGRSKRKYTDEKAVAQAVESLGENPYKEPELLGVTDMTKLLGKKKFENLLGEFIEKPQGKPTLASEDDPRPEMKNSAEEDFKNVIDENMEE